MTDKLRAAAEAALEAIEELEYRSEDPTANARIKAENAKRKLRTALAEPEHTPDCALLKIPSNDCDCAALVEPEADLVAWGVMKRGERVWYVNDSKLVCEGYASLYAHRDATGPDQSVVPLYTAPPHREWVGLTDEERLDFFDDYLARTPDGRHLFRHSWSYAEEEREAFDAGVAAAEAALKEKNT